MPVSTERVKKLVIKHLNEALSAPELEELNEWMNESPSHRQAIEEFLDEEKLKDNIRNLFITKEKVWQRLDEAISEKKVVPLYRRSSLRWITAASVVGLLLVAGYFLVRSREPGARSQESVASSHDVKAPMTNRAMITLADGKKVYLDSVGSGQLAMQGNVVLTKTADGKISYESGVRSQESGVKSSELRVQSSELVYNTLTNPRGSKVIDMTLSDGSHVWLNAGSSITYPVAFPAISGTGVGNERKVTVTGEADFVVAHNAKMPFKVVANGIEVKDIGTEFNVNAYDDEDAVRVTLLEGSVRVSKSNESNGANQSNEAVVIKPGEQVYTVSSGQLAVNKNVDLDEVMAWKNNLFDFTGTKIQAVMREVSRWYDINVEYKGKVSTDDFIGMVSRSENVSEVLKVMSATKKIKFDVEGKTVIVSSPE